MEKDKNDKWSKVEIVSKMLASLLIPLVIFIIGAQFNMQQKEAEEEQRKLDRIRGLISSLSGENIKEVEMTIEYCNYLDTIGEFPEWLWPTFLEMLDSDDAKIREGASKFAENRADRDSVVKDEVKKLFIDRVPTIYIQFTNEKLRNKAKAIQETLSENKYNAPGIELVKVALKQNEIRYFSVNDIQIAEQLKQIIDADYSTNMQLKDLSGTYKVKENVFEIWITE